MLVAVKPQSRNFLTAMNRAGRMHAQNLKRNATHLRDYFTKRALSNSRSIEESRLCELGLALPVLDTGEFVDTQVEEALIAALVAALCWAAHNAASASAQLRPAALDTLVWLLTQLQDVPKERLERTRASLALLRADLLGSLSRILSQLARWGEVDRGHGPIGGASTRSGCGDAKTRTRTSASAHEVPGTVSAEDLVAATEAVIAVIDAVSQLAPDVPPAATSVGARQQGAEAYARDPRVAELWLALDRSGVVEQLAAALLRVAAAAEAAEAAAAAEEEEEKKRAAAAPRPAAGLGGSGLAQRGGGAAAAGGAASSSSSSGGGGGGGGGGGSSGSGRSRESAQQKHEQQRRAAAAAAAAAVWEALSTALLQACDMVQTLLKPLTAWGLPSLAPEPASASASVKSEAVEAALEALATGPPQFLPLPAPLPLIQKQVCGPCLHYLLCWALACAHVTLTGAPPRQPSYLTAPSTPQPQQTAAAGIAGTAVGAAGAAAAATRAGAGAGAAGTGGLSDGGRGGNRGVLPPRALVLPEVPQESTVDNAGIVLVAFGLVMQLSAGGRGSSRSGSGSSHSGSSRSGISGSGNSGGSSSSSNSTSETTAAATPALPAYDLLTSVIPAFTGTPSLRHRNQLTLTSSVAALRQRLLTEMRPSQAAVRLPALGSELVQQLAWGWNWNTLLNIRTLMQVRGCPCVV